MTGIIGGGAFGLALAVALAQQRGLDAPTAGQISLSVAVHALLSRPLKQE